MSVVREECDKAISAHAAWKRKFKSMLDGEQRFDAAVIRKCDACEFGKWLEGAGRAALGAEHAAIYRAHAHFHAIAADVVELYGSGKKEQAVSAVALGGAFTKAGTTLTNLVVAARDRAT